MRAMKDSGIEWIGEIPEEWNVKRVKAVLCERNESNNPIQTDRILSLTNDRGVIPYEEKGDVGNKSKEDLTGYKLAYPGDIVLNSMNVFIGSVALSSYFGCVSPVYYMLYPRNKNDSVSFYNYLFQTKELQTKLHGYGNGIMEIRMRIQMAKLNSVQLPVPPSDVQQKIADYLDRKCSQIDAIIARQQEVIEKLKAYKLSVITEAVTKGLNPDVPMKDSGVEWIGEIPEQWKMVRLKFLLSHIIDCPHETPIYSADGDYLVIRTADQDLGKLRADEDMYRLDEGEYQNRIRRMSLEKEDIVYGREGERWGLACLVPESNKYCLGQRMLQFRCKNELFLPSFAMWALNSKFVYLQGAIDTIGSTSPHVNISTVRNFLIPVPNINEQLEIIEYVDKKMSQIDKEVEHREMLICKLNEYKKSLIYEVVTGKKEV